MVAIHWTRPSSVLPMLSSFMRRDSGLRAGGGARACEAGGCGAAAGAGTAEVQRALSERASHRRSALQCGSRDHRSDGSGSWAVCASVVVVAERGEHPRKGEALRADPAGVPHGTACAIEEL